LRTIFIGFVYFKLVRAGHRRNRGRAVTRTGDDAGRATGTYQKNNELLERLAFTTSLDFLTRMEGTDGKAMTDLYTRMVGAQQ
jgi:hypothetical protein